VHWLDLPDHDSALENDAPPPSARRRAAARLSLGLGAALFAATLGVLAAQGLGLTDTEPTAAAAAVGPPAQISEEPAAHPSFGRTPTLAPSSTVAPPPVAPEPEPEPAVQPASPAVPAAHTQAIPTVQQGDPCPTAGARGVTAKGRAMVCSGPGDGRTRWRRA
jgi:hypothetical protein